eukprot:c10012_g1_i1 orf=529-918(+)
MLVMHPCFEGKVMASHQHEPRSYADFGNDTTPSSSPSPSCDAASPHTLFTKSQLSSPDSITAPINQQLGHCFAHVADPATSPPTCHCLGSAQPQAAPTWRAHNEMSWPEMHTCDEPRHQHMHHHHHHHH